MLRIRILDIDVNRLMQAERIARSAVKQAGIQASVMPVGDRLEISRNGIMGALPAVEMNGRVVSTCQPITGELILSLIQSCS